MSRCRSSRILDYQNEIKDILMPPSILLVYSSPISPQRDEDFNRWYDSTHIPEVLGVPGFVGATRYRLSETQADDTVTRVQRYLSIYEVESSDLLDSLRALMAAASSMDLGDSMDWSTASAVLYEEASSRVTTDFTSATQSDS